MINLDAYECKNIYFGEIPKTGYLKIRCTDPLPKVRNDLTMSSIIVIPNHITDDFYNDKKKICGDKFVSAYLIRR